MICIDLAHTWAIAGVGKDFLGSALVFTAVRCSLFGRAVFEKQLELAYTHFKRWCETRGKRSTVDDFSKKTLKISSLLGQTALCNSRPEAEKLPARPGEGVRLWGSRSVDGRRPVHCGHGCHP